MIRLYFFGPPTAKPGLRQSYVGIKDVCHRADIMLSSNTEAREVNLPSDTIAELAAAGAPLLEAMQAIIVEGSTPDPQTAYLLAYAIAQKRPLLFLYTRGEAAPEVLRYLNARDVPKHVTIATYTAKTLERVVAKFLSTLGDVAVREVPRIKFTLRLTRTIDDFLDFKTRNTKITKADFLREEIERLMMRDEAFQRYLRKRGG